MKSVFKKLTPSKHGKYSKKSGPRIRRSHSALSLDMTDSADSPSSQPIKTTEPTRKAPTGLLWPTFQKVFLILLGYFFSHMQWPIVLVFIALLSLLWLERSDHHKVTRIRTKAQASSSTKHDLQHKLDEIPLWVKFPDRERAEWLNQVIVQMWPTLNTYIIKLFRGSIQAKIRKKFESFRFEQLDFGCNTPKVDGIKVYNSSSTKNSIIIDFDVFYDGNCDISFSLGGAQIGGIRDFQLSAEMRLVLKPILLKMPLIGGIQVFLLNTPDISFALEGLTAIPTLSNLLRTKIEEQISKLIVFPNKFTKRFSKSVEAHELKSLEPEGVLRVHVLEARDLMGKDISGKSDPYAVLSLCTQEYRTPFLNQTLNPKWDYWCEFIIGDPLSQHLSFKLYDHDNVNEDDFLGNGDVEVGTIIKGDTDQWLKLNNAKHGELHLRFTWLSFSEETSDLEKALEETRLLQVKGVNTALLSVYVDSAQNLPSAKNFVKPHPFVTIILSHQKQKSRVKKHTVNPEWEQGFLFLVPNPENDILYMTIADKQSSTILAQFCYNISELLNKPNLSVSKVEFPLSLEGTKIVLSMQLKIFVNKVGESEDDESSPESEDSFPLETPQITRNSIHSLGSKKSDVEERLSSSRLSVSHTPLRRSFSTSSSGEFNLGRIELSLNYSEPRQKFLVTIHRVCNLPVKDPNNIPDPYVKTKLIPRGTGSSIKNKTKASIDACDPIYEETFEYLLSKAEVGQYTLLIQVKSRKIFNNSILGEVEIDLQDLELVGERNWLDLCPHN